MNRGRVCQPCDMGLHGHCRRPECACCGDYDPPEAPPMPGDDELGREEDARLARQIGEWPDLPEASGR